MENHPKTATPTHAPAPAFPLAQWARHGMETFVASQKILLDLAAQQNSLAIGFVRERLAFSPFKPITGIMELAGHGLSNFIAAHKILLDLAAEENALFLQSVRDGLNLSGTPAILTDTMREGVQEFVDMQKKFLKLVEDQSMAAVEALKEGKPYEGKKLGEVTREGLENFVHTQKRFLDLVAEAAGYNGRTHKFARRKVSAMAKEGVDKFVEAQKDLLDVAARQIEATMKAAGEIMQPPVEPSTSLTDIARRSMDNFIHAQKSLLDVVTKPFLGPPMAHAHAHAHAGGRAAHKK
jgi:hypothetical protein